MEAVGARLGRSSTRYGPATVFSGPVRKWKKKWVHVSTTSSASTNSSAAPSHSHNPSIANNGSRLSLYKWTPLIQSNNGSNSNAGNNSGNDDAAELDEPPRRKFKYVSIALLEEQKIEAAENEDKAEDEAPLIDVDPSAVDPTRKGEILDEKPNINDISLEESQSQDNNQVVRQDLNESTLDLSLGLMAHDDDRESDSKLIK